MVGWWWGSNVRFIFDVGAAALLYHWRHTSEDCLRLSTLVKCQRPSPPRRTTSNSCLIDKVDCSGPEVEWRETEVKVRAAGLLDSLTCGGSPKKDSALRNPQQWHCVEPTSLQKSLVASRRQNISMRSEEEFARNPRNGR